MIDEHLGKFFKANPPTEDAYVYLNNGPPPRSNVYLYLDAQTKGSCRDWIDSCVETDIFFPM